MLQVLDLDVDVSVISISVTVSRVKCALRRMIYLIGKTDLEISNLVFRFIHYLVNIKLSSSNIVRLCESL